VVQLRFFCHLASARMMVREMSLVAACSSGKCPRVFDRLADLAVQALDRGGGIDGAAQLVGHGQEWGHVLPIGAPSVDGRRLARILHDAVAAPVVGAAELSG
jgi:hypothetical protein